MARKAKKVTKSSHVSTPKSAKKLPKVSLKISPKALHFIKLVVVTLLTLLALDAAIQFYTYATVIAEYPAKHIVVKKSAVVSKLLKAQMPTAPKQIIEYEVAKQVIQQDARAKKISVSKAELNAEIENLKKNYGNQETFEQTLAAQGLTLDDLKDILKVQILLKKLVQPEYKKPSEKELKDYFNKVKDTNPAYKGKKFEDVKAQLEKDYEDLRLSELQQKWVQDNLQEVLDNVVLYTVTPYRYGVGKGLLRLPVIREIAAGLKKNNQKTATPTKKEETQQPTQETTPTKKVTPTPKKK